MKMQDSLSRQIKDQAHQLGFDLVGIAPAVEAPHWDRLCEWVEQGFHAGMDYIPSRLAAYRHPAGVLPGCRSLVMVGASYPPALPRSVPLGCGRLAAYATRTDYHWLLRRRLRSLAQFVESLAPGTRARAVVDTAPLLERSFSWLAGLGWIGKNTMLIHPKLGSYLLLGAVLTTAELPADSPFSKEYCGRCRACLEVCPTGALVAPFTLDARRCLSYWTIEAKAVPPRQLRLSFDQWLFGCDLCQEVCPWNRRILRTGGFPGSRSPLVVEARQLRQYIDVSSLLQASEESLRSLFEDTPVWRSKPAGLRRNAAIVLGNCLRKEVPDLEKQCAELPPSGQLSRSTVPIAEDAAKDSCPGLSARNSHEWQKVLASALQDADPGVRQAAAWALAGRLTPAVVGILQQALAQEADPEVREEISTILSESSADSRIGGNLS